MVNFNQFLCEKSLSMSLYNAINYCKKNNEDCLVFDKGKYEFDGDMSSESILKVSNHDIYGIKRIGFLIEEMNNFTIDGCGSEFVFHDAVTAFAIKNSKNITLKNFSIDYDETMTLEGKIINVGDDYFDFKIINNDGYYIKGGELRVFDKKGNDDKFHYIGIRSFGEDKSFIPESQDAFFVFKQDIYFEDLVDDKAIRIYNTGLDVKVGMRVITRGTERFASNIVISDSKDITVDSVTMYKSYAMGLLAQKSENVFVDKMTVKAKKETLFSLNCDATHFVHCKGLVKVTNSNFSDQQDDALNIHGIFTRIVDKTDDYIIVKYMHKSAKGLGIYDKGSEIAVLNSKSLIPIRNCIIEDVEEINMNYTKLYIQGGTDGIDVGNNIEDLTWSCDLIFENNRVVNNRARGMLIAAKGNVLIKNNYFNTPGVAILFESDGEKWFESGGTTNVEIKENVFDNCRYTRGNWGSNVIEIKPREMVEKQKYYHNYINITKNKFINCNSSLLYADNVKNIVFENNIIDNVTAEQYATFINCGEITTDL